MKGKISAKREQRDLVAGIWGLSTTCKMYRSNGNLSLRCLVSVTLKEKIEIESTVSISNWGTEDEIRSCRCLFALVQGDK